MTSNDRWCIKSILARRASCAIGIAMMLMLPAAAQNVTFHNSLDSDAAVLHSVVGPPLAFYTGGNRPYQTVVGTRAYVPGVSGNAFTLGPAPYISGIRAHAIELPNPGSVLNAEHGTIEAWYFSIQEPSPYLNNSHTLFGEMLDCTYEAGIALYVNHPAFWNTARVVFTISLCGTTLDAISITDGIPGYALVNRLNQWLHFAAVWDRAGIAGSSDTLRLYVNGQLVAKNNAADWGTTFGPVATVGGASDWAIAGKYYEDDLKLWDGARTTFEPRISFLQPRGAGTYVLGMHTQLIIGHEYFTLFSLDLSPNGAGTGPWAGLSFNDVDTLVAQLGAPIGPVPGHFIATRPDTEFGRLVLPLGLTFESVCIEVTGGILGPISPSVRYTVH